MFPPPVQDESYRNAVVYSVLSVTCSQALPAWFKGVVGSVKQTIQVARSVYFFLVLASVFRIRATVVHYFLLNGDS